MDRLEEDILSDTFQSELSGDDSEEDWDPSAYDSDYAGYSLSYFKKIVLAEICLLTLFCF